MNRNRRTRINKVKDKLSDCQDELTNIMDEEDEARENMPENLQDAERYQISEECSDALSDAIDSIGGALESLEDIQ